MMSANLKPLLAGTSALTCLLATTPVHAQDTAAPAAGEIVVTAQKREQRINDVGMVITAASAETLAKRGVQGPSDLVKITPGLTYTDSLYSTPVFTLRGIGLYDSTFAALPSVAVYTDQVPRNVSLMGSALDLDLERVEVLKGPQGTIFGQSATGGAINFITAKPTRTFKAGMDISVERFGKVIGSGFVSGPLGETVQARLAVGGTTGGAWQVSTTRPGDKNGASRQLNGRLSLDWEPAPGAKISFTATGARDRSDPIGFQNQGSRYNAYADAASLAASGNPYGVVNPAIFNAYASPTSAAFDPSFTATQQTLVDRLNGAAATPVIPDLQNQTKLLLGAPIATNARQADWSPGFFRHIRNDYYQFTLRGDFELSDHVTLTSVTASARQKVNMPTDIDATASNNLDVVTFGSVATFNQELRLTGKSDHLNWLLGATYDNVHGIQQYDFTYSGWSKNGYADPFFSTYFTGNHDLLETRTRTYAGYGNVEYKFDGGLSLQAGLRYTRNEISASYCSSDNTANGNLAALFSYFSGVTVVPGQCEALGDGNFGTTFFVPTLVPFKNQLNQGNLSFRGGATYKLSGGTLLYASVSQGYKSGLFSAISPSSTSQYAPAVQEKVVSYEAGFKAPLLDRKVQFNGGLFYYDYTDKQLRGRILDPVFGLLEKMINVPKSYVWGVEAELHADPVPGLAVNVAGTWLKSKVSGDFSQTPDGLPVYNAAGYTGNFRGSALPFTPQFSGNADVQYTWDQGGVKPFIGASARWQSGSNATFVNSVVKAPEDALPGYAVFDARIGVGSADGRWQLSAFGRNVFNRYYFTSAGEGFDTSFTIAGRPAVFGLALRLRTN